MPRPRVTIGWMMGFTAASAVVFGALRSLNGVWASAIYSAALMTVLVAAFAGSVKPRRTRAIWWGYAAFAAMSLTFSFSPRAWLNNPGLRPPPFITAILIPRGEVRSYLPGGFTTWNIVTSNNLGGTSQVMTDPGGLYLETGSPPSSRVVLQIAPADQTLHSFAALLCGAFGAGLVALCTRSDRRLEP